MVDVRMYICSCIVQVLYCLFHGFCLQYNFAGIIDCLLEPRQCMVMETVSEINGLTIFITAFICSVEKLTI